MTPLMLLPWQLFRLQSLSVQKTIFPFTTPEVRQRVLQPRSQGLSSLPPLVVGRKTLVAAGHMTTQNLGGKKICWVGGAAEYFVWLM